MRLLTLFTLILITYGCSSDVIPDEITTVFASNKVITHDSLCTNIDIVDGENLIFKWSRDSDKSSDEFQDDFYEELLFEIPIDSDENFFLQDSLFANNTLIYQNICVGRCTGQYVGIQNGEIRGIRLDSLEWDISIDVELIGTVVGIKIHEQFSKGEL